MADKTDSDIKTSLLNQADTTAKTTSQSYTMDGISVTRQDILKNIDALDKVDRRISRQSRIRVSYAKLSM